MENYVQSTGVSCELVKKILIKSKAKFVTEVDPENRMV